MAEGNRQLRGSGADETDSILMWDYTHSGEAPPVTRKGTFSNANIIPGNSQYGYDDNAAGFLTVERVLYATAPTPKSEIVRTGTGKVYFIEAIDDSSPVVYLFTLSIREL